jgi:hypothetical protein
VTTSPANAAPRSRLRRIESVGLVVVGVVMLVAVAAWLLFPSPSLPWTRIGWRLHAFGGPAFDPAMAQTTTEVKVYVASSPEGYIGDDVSWLATPAITYTPWGVIVTLHTSDSVPCGGKESRPLPGGGSVSCWYDVGEWVPVHLSEPLGGRALFDGSAFPPAARPYP